MKKLFDQEPVVEISKNQTQQDVVFLNTNEFSIMDRRDRT